MNAINGFLISSCLLLSACGDVSSHKDAKAGFQKASYTKQLNAPAKAVKKRQLPNGPVSISWPGKGKRIPDKVMLSDPLDMVTYHNGKIIRHDNDPLEKFIAEHGTITFRKGEDFFADWALSITLEDLKPESTIVLKRASGMLNVREPGEKLPTTHFLEDAQGIIKTGKLSKLGMPIQVSFSTREKPFMNKPVKPGNYIVAGKAFATIGNIKVKDGKLDRQYDSLSTVILVAKDYLEQIQGGEKFSVQHVRYSSDENKKGEREGYEGLVVLKKATGNQLFRVHLLKQSEGWQGVEIFPPWKLTYKNMDKSKYADDRMQFKVSKMLESLLKRKKIKNHIDTDVSCTYSDSMGLCTAKIGLLKDDDKICSQKAYWFKKKGKTYKFIKEVSPDMDIEYVDKKHILLKSKRKSKSIKDYVLDKTTGLMVGKCGTF